MDKKSKVLKFENKNTRNPNLVTVEWRDILGTSGREKPSELTPPTFWTTGYLIHKCDQIIKVAHTKDEAGEWTGISAFPSGCVKRIKNNPS